MFYLHALPPPTLFHSEPAIATWLPYVKTPILPSKKGRTAMLSPAHSGSLATAAMGLQHPKNQGWIVHSDHRRPTPRRMFICWFARTDGFSDIEHMLHKDI